MFKIALFIALGNIFVNFFEKSSCACLQNML